MPAIEPDIRGAVTIREQLIKHREIATCAACHRKIDPLGFALENYDAIGGWRETYGDLPIDATGKLPNGATFKTCFGIPQTHQARQDQFTRCLAERLLTYALGRELEIGDRPQIDAITARLKHSKTGLRDLVEAIVLSETFRTN